MQKNTVKQALTAGKLQLGAGVSQIRSAEVARVFAAAGFDWAFVDTEHGGFGIETVQDFCRVADMQYPLVARALDCGAQGIIFPRVESRELLAQAVRWTRFPAEGVRGYGLGGPQLAYQKHTFADVIEHMNANMLVVLQIETVAAFEAREKLLSIPGIDAVLIGPADLSISLGIPGNFEHPLMVVTIEAIRDSCQRYGIAPGIHVRSAALAKFWEQRGMRFLSCGNDVSFLYEKASEIAEHLRG